MPRSADPLNFGFLLQADGRWNRPGEYGCLYTALTPQGAIAEYNKFLAGAGVTRAQDAARDLVTIMVNVTPVLDLSDPTTASDVGVDAQDVTRDDDETIELCRTIAPRRPHRVPHRTGAAPRQRHPGPPPPD